MKTQKKITPNKTSRRIPALLLTTLLASTAASEAVNYTWANTGTDWNSAASWNPSTGTPSAGGDVVIFNTVAGTNPNLSASATISRLTANSSTATGYTLTSSGGAALTVGTTGITTSSAINYTPSSGTFAISAPIILGAAEGATQTFNVNSGGTLAVSGPVSSTNSVRLQKSGAGTLILSGAANSYSGGTIISAGTVLLSGAGTLGTGDLALAGGTFDISGLSGSGYSHASALTGTGSLTGGSKTLAVNGLSASGTILVANITLSLEGTSTFDFADPGFGAGTFDLLQGSVGGTESVVFDGALVLNFAGGAYLNGSSVQIFAVDNYAGTFDSVSFSGLGLGQSAVFDAATGSVTVVPEPGVCALAGLGVIFLSMRRRARARK
jgi:fibronectin-binding autotransporter adhesin